ncbi:hypothetical protein ACLTEW_15295 [Gordonia lacunae]|uniref:hypothetical protein n=1 Tax=Gordonia lacunae TaxID=417102 RepID=UPI0039E6BD2B
MLTTSSAESQEIEQYRRDVRKDLYARMISEMDTFSRVCDELSVSRGFVSMGSEVEREINPPADDRELLRRADERVRSAERALSESIASAELLASRQVIELSKRFQVQCLRSATQALSEMARRLKNMSVGVETPPVAPEVPYQGIELAELRRAFIKAAKADLALDD